MGCCLWCKTLPYLTLRVALVQDWSYHLSSAIAVLCSDPTYTVARAMAAPTLCTTVPDEIRARMAEAARMQSAAPQHLSGLSEVASSNGHVDPNQGDHTSCSSRCSTSSSGSSSASSGLLTEDAEADLKLGRIKTALENPAMAIPSPPISSHQSLLGNNQLTHTLPRADLLVLGGDLAYPNPSNDTYENRFFR